MFASLTRSIGATWGDYVAALANDAILLPVSLGDNTSPVRLIQVSIDNAIAAVNTSMTGSILANDPSVSLSGRLVHAINTDSDEAFAAYTRSDGTFVFPELSAGDYSLTYDGAVTTAPVLVSVAAGQAVRGVEVNVVPGALLSGVVTSQDSGHPVNTATVRITGLTGAAFSVHVADDGSYEFDGLAADTYRMVIEADGYARSEVDGIALGTGTLQRSVSLLTEASVSANISIPAGADGTTFTISAHPSGQNDPNDTFTENSSSTDLLLTRLPVGAYDITISANGYVSQTFANRRLQPGQVLSLGTVSLVLALWYREASYLRRPQCRVHISRSSYLLAGRRSHP